MIVLLKPWPMCRLPVTFGGGIMMQYDPSPAACLSDWLASTGGANQPASSQR